MQEGQQTGEGIPPQAAPHPKWIRAQEVLSRDREHEGQSTFVGYVMSAAPLWPLTGDIAAGRSNDFWTVAGLMTVVAVGLGVLLWRWSLRSWTPAGFSWAQMSQFIWHWLCVVGAGSIPAVIFVEWNKVRGALPTWQYVTMWGTAIGVYIGLRLVGAAARRPTVAAKVVGWAGLVVIGGSIAFAGLGAVMEAVSVKALLIAILAVLLYQTFARPHHGA